MQKRTIIKRIKGIIERFGGFSPSDLNENSPVIHSIGSTYNSVKSLSETVYVITFHNGIEIADDYVSYEDLSKEVLEEILFLTELFETDSLKTKKRIS